MHGKKVKDLLAGGVLLPELVGLDGLEHFTEAMHLKKN
jgi:hypothetical protein